MKFLIISWSIYLTFFTGVLKETVALIKAGASVRETCIHADKRIEEETGKAFKKDKQLQKGKKNRTNLWNLKRQGWPFKIFVFTRADKCYRDLSKFVL